MGVSRLPPLGLATGGLKLRCSPLTNMQMYGDYQLLSFGYSNAGNYYRQSKGSAEPLALVTEACT